ncbi:unnamed protein product [marine sediment metagenome]|uniref:Uncharacterized protein n=1 Tax=marine sediment metagenome TaxID=412755 RepID=X1F0Q3_9ZZZZ
MPESEQFNKPLYNHLIQHCSFIAHYDRAGFYSTYFESGNDIAVFLSQFDKNNVLPNGIPPSAEYNSTWWVNDDYGDINMAMIETATKYIPNLLERARQKQKNRDIGQARTLLAKYGL